MDYSKYIDGVKNEKTIKTYDSIWRNYLKQFSSDGKISSSKTKQIITYVNGLDKSSSTKKAIFSLLINILQFSLRSSSILQHGLNLMILPYYILGIYLLKWYFPRLHFGRHSTLTYLLGD